MGKSAQPSGPQATQARVIVKHPPVLTRASANRRVPEGTPPCVPAPRVNPDHGEVQKSGAEATWSNAISLNNRYSHPEAHRPGSGPSPRNHAPGINAHPQNLTDTG